MGRFAFIRRTGAEWTGGAAACAALTILASAARPAAAADVVVFTSAAPAVVEQALAAAFTQATGNRILFDVGTVREIQAKLAGSGRPDIVVLPAAALEAADKASGMRPGSRIDLAQVDLAQVDLARVDLARVGIGVVVRAGAPLPDISSVDALRQTLLAARSIAHPDPQGGGFAGAQIARMFARLGIADAIKPKISLAYAFTGGVAQVADGEAEIGLFNISEILPVKGVTLVGSLVPELQSYITFSAALPAGSAAPEPAAGFLRALSDPKASEAWRAAGFEPIGGEH
jgi:molybdate transport system substrate-binding protein